MSSPQQEAEAKPTIVDQIEAAQFGKFQWVALSAFVLFILSDGMELVVTNVIWRVLPREEWGMEDDFRAVLISATYMGFVLGSVAGGIAGDWIGRKAVIYAHGAVFIPASIASAFSDSMYQLLVTRFFVGISMGALLPTTVSLMAELSPRAERGVATLTIPGMSYSAGSALVLVFGLMMMGVCGMEGEHCEWWRWMLVAGLVPDIAALVLVVLYVPESPRFLLVKGRVDEAEGVIRHVAEMNGTTERLLDGGALQPLPDEETSSNYNADQQFLSLFEPPVRDMMALILSTWSLLSISMWVAGHLYPIVLEEQGVSAADEYFLMIQWCAIEPLMLLVIMYIMGQPWGSRRSIIAWLTCGAVLGALVAALTIESGLVWVHASQIMLRLLAVGPYEMFYVYSAELLPTSHRNQGVSFGNAMTKFLAVLTPLIFIPLYHASHAGPYYIIAGTSALSAAIMLFVAPDVQKNLTDVASQLTSTTPLLKRTLRSDSNELPPTAPLP